MLSLTLVLSHCRLQVRWVLPVLTLAVGLLAGCVATSTPLASALTPATDVSTLPVMDINQTFVPSGWDWGKRTQGEQLSPKIGMTPMPGGFEVHFDPSADSFFQVFWQYPANNWDCKPKGDAEYRGGLNLQGARRVLVTAWGQNGGEVVNFGSGQACPPPLLSFASRLITVTLSKTPTVYEVAQISRTDDVSDVASIFHFLVGKQPTSAPIVFYLKDIVVEGISQPGVVGCEPPTMTITPLPQADLATNLATLTRKLSTLAWIPSDCSRERLEDLKKQGFRGIVTYGTGPLDNLPLVAREIGFEGVILGIGDPTSQAEVNRAIALRDYVDGYVVGNEVLARKRGDLDKTNLSQAEKDGEVEDAWRQIQKAMVAVRAATNKPVTTTEVVDDVKTSEIMAAGDWFFPNAHPYYRCIWDPGEAVKWTVDTYAAVKQQTKGKFVSFKEVGLPRWDIDKLPDCKTVKTVLDDQSPVLYYSALEQARCRGEAQFVYFFFTPPVLTVGKCR